MKRLTPFVWVDFGDGQDRRVLNEFKSKRLKPFRYAYKNKVRNRMRVNRIRPRGTTWPAVYLNREIDRLIRAIT